MSYSSEGNYVLGSRSTSMHLLHVANYPSSLISESAPPSSALLQRLHAAPSSLFFNYPTTTGGKGPSKRWAHSMCAVGDSIVVFGGMGEKGYSGTHNAISYSDPGSSALNLFNPKPAPAGHSANDDTWCLDPATMQWKALSPRPASSSKDRPEKTYAHAAAAVGRRMYVFGGQQRQALLRQLFVLDLDSLTWTKVSNSSLPSARAGHAMAAAEGSVFLFGGQGKALSNDLYR